VSSQSRDRVSTPGGRQQQQQQQQQQAGDGDNAMSTVSGRPAADMLCCVQRCCHLELSNTHSRPCAC
jgi:hypothetical protein